MDTDGLGEPDACFADELSFPVELLGIRLSRTGFPCHLREITVGPIRPVGGESKPNVVIRFGEMATFRFAVRYLLGGFVESAQAEPHRATIGVPFWRSR